MLLPVWVTVLLYSQVALIRFLKLLSESKNAAVRVLTTPNIRDHIPPILASLHWLPVKLLIQLKILVLTYTAIYSQSSSYLQQLVVPSLSPRTLRSQDSGLLVILRISRSQMGGGAFGYQAPLLLRHLPVSVQKADTLCDFVSRIKTFLF